MTEERNTSQEQTGAHNSPEGVSYERLAQQSAPRISVEERAAELARIDGRSAEDVREEDREQAREELAATPSELPEPPRPEDVDPTFPAHRVDEPQTSSEEDEQLLAEELARRGTREAEHDTMVRERAEEEESGPEEA
ncbi:MAG: hypothetical protein ACLFTU_08820 [Puniceicoccaceae bacterium]